MGHNRTQRVFGIIGRSGAGKTHLISRLIPFFSQQGLCVSTIKHTHHGVDMDKPGKDTFLHRQHGAVEVMLATPQRWILQHEAASPPVLNDLIKAMRPVDLILIEGFHAEVPATMEVWRSITGKEAIFTKMERIKSVATDALEYCHDISQKPVFHIDDLAGIAHHIQTHAFLWTDQNGLA